MFYLFICVPVYCHKSATGHQVDLGFSIFSLYKPLKCLKSFYDFNAMLLSLLFISMWEPHNT